METNSKLDLREILKDCPKGTKLYSPLFGEVEFIKIIKYDAYSIIVSAEGREQNSTEDGRYYLRYTDGECLLFPSKDNRNWNTWIKPETPAQNVPTQSEHQALGDEQMRNTIIEMIGNSGQQGDPSFYIDWPKATPVPVFAPTGKVEVFILEPKTEKLCIVKDWKKDSSPKRAEWVAIRNEKGETILLHKKNITVDGRPVIKFNKANEAAAAFFEGGHTGSRKNWIDVYEAIHTAGLNNALKLIGGEPIKKEWYWTREKDSDQSAAACTWLFGGGNGDLGNGDASFGAHHARVFRDFGVETL